MSKKKSKQQKRQFFGRKDNRGKVFKKRESVPVPAEEKSKKIRIRGQVTRISSDGLDVPHCSHGPCLLFLDKENSEKFFACAVYRDNELCTFKAVVADDGSVTQTSEEPVQKLKRKFVYGRIPKKLKRIPRGSELVYCSECTDVFEQKHACPCEYVTRKQLRMPSRLLEAHEEQKGVAQFWFSDDSMSIITSTISSFGADGVLCIGAARLFEVLRAEKVPGRSLFMLDFDQRYTHFYLRSSFTPYSMLVDFFFDRHGESRLLSFLSRVNRLLIVSDPPFGVLIQPLIRSIENIRQRHKAANPTSSSYSMLFLPLFIGKYALRNYSGDLWMSDYRVCYENHKVFAKPNKTTVRIFTDLPKDSIDLTGVKGYRFCDMCEKHVLETNKHCGLCGDCTAKDGSQEYHHCGPCMRCVKASYIHCRLCSRCHLKGRCPSKKEQAPAFHASNWSHQEEDGYYEEMEE